MRGDPYTGRIFHYGSWVWRVESGGEGTSQAHEAAGRRVPSPGNTVEAEGQNHPDMEFEEFAIPDDQPMEEARGSQANPAKTFPVGEIGPITADWLGMDSPTEVARLKKKNEEMTLVLKSQTDELAKLSAAWVEENKADAARVLTATPEATMESFRLLYRETEGKKMITAIGSFGFKSGEKKDRIASHRVLLKRDPAFSAASYGLAPIPEEEPTPPFPLD
ncbi:unnamed protein product [Cuscuta campestris]|uniref:Uncharacterized protein n=1 Tax=Cuscuta campestris TaxID=132261 RepID=A0A484KXE2_9ASTE|nr:unnamed protein product [Cuscuta campestris]